jgi:hypothetical protein
MTQKFSSKLFGSNILRHKKAVCMTSMLGSKNALQHEKGHNAVHLTHCNTWPFSDTRVKYERVTFCSLLLYISIDLLSFVHVANSYISKLPKNLTNVLVTSITLSHTNNTKCPLCSTNLLTMCYETHANISVILICSSPYFKKIYVTVTNFVHSSDHSLHVIIFLRTPFI